MDAWLRALGARSGWVAPSRLVNAAGEPTDDVRIVDAARNAQSYEGEHARWRRAGLPREALAAVRRHTACDAALYAAAQALLNDTIAQQR
jgi:hypothetical protein